MFEIRIKIGRAVADPAYFLSKSENQPTRSGVNFCSTEWITDGASAAASVPHNGCTEKLRSPNSVSKKPSRSER
jgi:hypothetical protein